MRKNIIFALCAIAMMVTLTACGNEKTPSYTIEYRDNDDQQVTTSVSDENPANVDNSGHEPDSYKSGNFQDYWEGEDYFDIVGFAEANGATYTMWCTGDGKAADASQANACKFFFKDKWKVIVNVDFIIIEQDGSDASFLVVYEQNSSESISVCKENNVICSENVIQAFNTIVECLKTSSDKANPFEGSGLPCY